MLNMTISPKGDSLIKASETLRLVGYLCPAGKPTNGWGHTGPEVVVGQAITLDKAIANFAYDKQVKAESTLNKWVRVALNQNQFDALGSLVFNIGAGNFATSTLLRKLNAGDYAGAADQFTVWNKATDPNTKQLVVMPGLVTRRAAERALFLTAA